MDWVVDTNVLVVANERETVGVSAECVLACCDAIQEIQQDGRLVIDSRWEILGEYQTYARSDGQPGLGDVFLKWILTNLENESRCKQVLITPLDGPPWYKEFPSDPGLSGFDRSDRKFVAVALAHGKKPPILNAVDTDWWEYRRPLERVGVVVEFLCPAEVQRRRG